MVCVALFGHETFCGHRSQVGGSGRVPRCVATTELGHVYSFPVYCPWLIRCVGAVHLLTTVFDEIAPRVGFNHSVCMWYSYGMQQSNV